MTYHPIFGIVSFFLFMIIAFMIGRKSFIVNKKNNIVVLKRNKVNSDSISPDASWLK